MFKLHDAVQIVNHSEPSCNGQYGHVTQIDVAYNGRTLYYIVELEDSGEYCSCLEEELMEG